ncbi:unnamed protein product [Caenorhabditis nigoni]
MHLKAQEVGKSALTIQLIQNFSLAFSDGRHAPLSSNTIENSFKIKEKGQRVLLTTKSSGSNRNHRCQFKYPDCYANSKSDESHQKRSEFFNQALENEKCRTVENACFWYKALAIRTGSANELQIKGIASKKIMIRGQWRSDEVLIRYLHDNPAATRFPRCAMMITKSEWVSEEIRVFSPNTSHNGKKVKESAENRKSDNSIAPTGSHILLMTISTDKEYGIQHLQEEMDGSKQNGTQGINR